MTTLATHPEHTGRHDLPLSGLDLPLYRLYLMRAGYLLMGVGIAVVKWPQIVSHGDDWPLFEGVVACILTAMSLLAFLGLRYPVRLLPLLLFGAMLASNQMLSKAIGKPTNATEPE